MIDPLPGWTFEASDTEVALAPLDRAAAVICYRERLRPIATVTELVKRHCRGGPERVTQVGDVETMFTREGELAAVASFDVEGEAETVGWVFIDDFYSQTRGRAREPAARERVSRAVRTLVAGDTHGMTGRQRLFHHEGPAGWRKVRHGSAFRHVWLPSDEDPSRLVILAARPADGGDPRALAGMLAALGVSDATLASRGRLGPETIRTAAGMPGDLWQLFAERDGAAWVRFAAALRGPKHVYGLFLDCPLERARENRRHLELVVRSIHAVPAPPRAKVAAAGLAVALAHWGD